MLTNAACTLYLTKDKKEYTRVFCPAVHWEDVRGRNVNKTGSEAVDSVKVWIPLDAADLDGQSGYIVRGECAFQPSEENPVRALLTAERAFTLTSSARYDFGSPSMQHWEVYAK